MCLDDAIVQEGDNWVEFVYGTQLRRSRILKS